MTSVNIDILIMNKVYIGTRIRPHTKSLYNRVERCHIFSSTL